MPPAKILAAIAVFFALVCGGNNSNTATPKFAEATEILDSYRALGEHRSGTAVDAATSGWLVDELQARGIDAVVQDWPLALFQLRDSYLEIEDRRIDAFPFWYPIATGAAGLAAPLVMADGATDDSMNGAIALFRLPPGKFEVHYDAAPDLRLAATQGALAAVIIIDHPAKAVSAQNAVGPNHQIALPLPALIAAEKDAEQLLALAARRADARLIVDGHSQRANAANVIARIERGAKHWIVISTPISGWFEATNERGPGIALWLQLAEWASMSGLQSNVLFVGLSGHELDQMGMEALINSGELPNPDTVAMWLHLGSGIAVENPLLSVVSSVSELNNIVDQTLLANTAMTYWPEEKMPTGSEQYRAMQLGYPVVGLFGAGPTIHTRLDQAPRIDVIEYDRVYGALQQLVQRQITKATRQ